MLQRYAELQKVPNSWDILHKNVMNSPSGGSHLPVFRGAFRVTNGHNYRYLPLRILLRRHFTAGL